MRRNLLDIRSEDEFEEGLLAGDVFIVEGMEDPRHGCGHWFAGIVAEDADGMRHDYIVFEGAEVSGVLNLAA
jgi:hypothetical protein